MPQETSPETSQQTTNTQETTFETSPQETSQATTDEATVQAQQQKSEPQQPSTPKRTQGDRIAELENKLARMEAIYQLQGQNVVDMEVCADLILKGYTIEQLKQSKPYLFQNTQNTTQTAPLGFVRQPQKVVAETQTPKQPVSSAVSSESFVKTLANMLTSKF